MIFVAIYREASSGQHRSATMLTKLKILMIRTSSTTMGETNKSTGLRFDELATPYYAFVDAGAWVTLALIRGGPAPIDPRSVNTKGENEASVDRFLLEENASTALNETLPVCAVDISEYDARCSCRAATARCGTSPRAPNWPCSSARHGRTERSLLQFATARPD
jgi:hypothetical protein